MRLDVSAILAACAMILLLDSSLIAVIYYSKRSVIELIDYYCAQRSKLFEKLSEELEQEDDHQLFNKFRKLN